MGSEVRGVFDLRSKEVRGPSIRPSQGCIFGKGPRSADQKGGNKRIEGHGNGLVVAVVAPVTFRYGSSEGSDPQQATKHVPQSAAKAETMKNGGNARDLIHRHYANLTTRVQMRAGKFRLAHLWKTEESCHGRTPTAVSFSYPIS